MKLHTFQYKQGSKIELSSELDSINTLIIAFFSPDMINNPAFLKELSKQNPKSQVIGCSTAGEILNTKISDNSISVAIIRFEKTTILAIKKEIQAMENSFNTGESIAKELNKEDLCGIFVLSDGLNVNGTELVKGLNTIPGQQVVITGGLAGDGSQFKQTWTFINGELLSSHVVAVGFYGKSIQISNAFRGGWDIFGFERRITRSRGNILYELDNLPALTLYKEYLGDRAAGLPATGLLFPLAIRKSIEDKNPIVRTILAVDEKTNSLTFAGDMPMNYLAQLMHANFDRLIIAAEEAAHEASSDLLKVKHDLSSPVLAIAISCVGRRLLLGEKTEEEVEATLKSMPQGTQQIGFYSYGEISPDRFMKCDLHNQTMTLTILCEL